MRYIAPEGTFPKIWSILSTLAPFNLLLHNFPGPLAFRITIWKVLTTSGQLFIKIWPQAARYSRFCEIIFGKCACPFGFNLPRCCANKVLLFDRESNLRLYEPCDIVLKGECTLPGAWAPGRAQKIELYLTRWHFSQKFCQFCQPWCQPFSSYRIFLDLSLSESQSTWS